MRSIRNAIHNPYAASHSMGVRLLLYWFTMALLLVAAMFVGTLLPNVELGQVSLNLGGAVIPLGVCIYLLFTCGDGKEVGRTLVGTVLTAAAVYALSVFLPE